ncbi:TRAP transporter large permease [Xanthobacter tagetidis]|jgi:tripartite ATP-independent transporter DctM subunit|uniref:TRAP transporter large permease protein n=1 Tax=Xanthobacter tagetidis TaxID=60216 RepID=A0A3L7A9R3_9HYPH|nr:TRAP transporter large permease subunit [Xanthobacter tagetidis]MBB6309593.1 tripartite ATP-independent transporter DctM subunit [Xanthobacter tagetidis]RLP77146.1 TRAP transporter large permease subunit [Xanthobacter tagetidis]
MSIEYGTLLIVTLMVALMVIGLPLAFVTAFTAGVFGFILFGTESFFLIVSRIFTLMNNYALISVPLFVLMGCILERSGLVEGMFKSLHLLVGRIPGGLAVATIVASTIMAAMVGVIGAEIVTLGLVCLPAMLRRGYDKRLVSGVICAGGSLGTMIPPSVVLIVYGLVAQVSIGKLFMAAIGPGLLLAGLYAAYTVFICWRRPELAPLPDARESAAPLSQRLAEMRQLIAPALLIAFVMTCFYTGIATPTEVGALGTLGALVILAVNGQFTFANLRHSVVQTGRTVAMVTWIFFGASALVGIYTLAGGTDFLRGEILDLGFSPLGTLLMMMGILIVLGCFIDWIGIALLTMPIFVPIIKSLGYDPVWFGILFCMNMQLSYLSPPFGPAAFYLKGVAPPEVSLSDIFAGVWPFILLQLVALGMVIALPEIAMWLPAHTQ